MSYYLVVTELVLAFSQVKVYSPSQRFFYLNITVNNIVRVHLSNNKHINDKSCLTQAKIVMPDVQLTMFFRYSDLALALLMMNYLELHILQFSTTSCRYIEHFYLIMGLNQQERLVHYFFTFKSTISLFIFLSKSKAFGIGGEH